jgi:DNA polymerase-3 subunit gamma/tau
MVRPSAELAPAVDDVVAPAEPTPVEAHVERVVTASVADAAAADMPPAAAPAEPPPPVPAAELVPEPPQPRPMEAPPKSRPVPTPEPEPDFEPEPLHAAGEPVRWSFCEACGHAFIVSPASARAARAARGRRRGRACEQRRRVPVRDRRSEIQPSA